VIGSEVGEEGHAGHPDAAADAQNHCLYPRAGNGVRGKKVAGGRLDGEGVAVHVSYQFVAALALHISGLFVLAGEYIASFVGQQASLAEILGASSSEQPYQGLGVLENRKGGEEARPGDRHEVAEVST